MLSLLAKLCALLTNKEYIMPSDTVIFDPLQSKYFAAEIVKRSGQPIYSCYQCHRCAAGCPVAEDTNHFTPDKLIRLILFGDHTNAIQNRLVWSCVSCFTCGTRCPNNIQTSKITDVLKTMHKERHIEALNPKSEFFHDAFFKSGLRWGRVNELEFMATFETRHLFHHLKRKEFKAMWNEIVEQAKFGKQMRKLKRLHFQFQTSQGRKELKELAQKNKQNI